MDYKLSNLTISKTTRLNNFKFSNFTNIAYINTTINTDSLQKYYLTTQNSNTTYIINNINTPIYKKIISEIKKYPDQIFVSNNHNLKVNDLITLENIKKNTIPILTDTLQTNYIIFKVIDITKHTFRLQSSNNYNSSLNSLTNIIKTSSQLMNSYFYLRSTKTYKLVTSITNKNIITIPNHTFKVNDIIEFENITNIKTNYIHSQFKVTAIDTINSSLVTITEILNNDSDIFTLNTHTFTQHVYAKLVSSTQLNKTLTIVLPNINTITDAGLSYNFIINDHLESFSVITSTNDILLGTNKISSSELISSDLIHSTDRANKFIISNIDLLYSQIKIISLGVSKWFIDSNITNNVIRYKITYDSETKKFSLNNVVLTPIDFYINLVYEFDLSSSTLLNNDFILTDLLFNHILKNTSYIGKIGTPNAKLLIYFDNTFTINSQINIKYKINSAVSNHSYILFGTIKSFPNPFSTI